MTTIVFYLPIFLLGAVTTYTDLRYGIIKNKHLLYAALYGIIFNVYFAFQQSMSINVHVILNLLLGIGIGVILYALHSWGAGDAKLFMVYCLLLPTGSNAHIVPFNSLALFINIFLFSLFILIPLIIFKRTKSGEASTPFSKVIEYTFRDLFDSLLITLCLAWIVPHLVFSLSPYLGREGFLYIALLYISYHGIYSLFKRIAISYKVAISLAVIGFMIRIHVEHFENLWGNIGGTLKTTVIYSLIFHNVRDFLTVNMHRAQMVRFSPVMFCGVLLSNTQFVSSFMKLLKIIRGVN